MPAAELLRRPYRPVRHVVAGADSPWPGVLSWLASGEARLLVDTRELAPDWPGWAHAPDGHIAAADDLARTDDGHAAVLPVCVERMAAFLERRARAGVPLSPGESVTLGVSIVRARDQLGEHTEVTGDWWLSDAGRPLFTATPTGPRFADASATVLEAASTVAPANVPWTVAGDLLPRPRVSVHDIDDAEDAFFAFADPARLATVTPNPHRAGLDDHDLRGRDAGSSAGRAADGPAVGGAGRAGADRAATEVGARPPLSDALLRHVDADIADLASRAATDVWRRVRRLRMPRHAPMLLAVLLAAVILVAGLLWPTGGDSPTDGHVGGTTDTPVPAATSSTSPIDTSDAGTADASATPTAGAAPAEEDLESVLSDLLERRLGCEDDECLRAVLSDPAMTVPAGPASLESATRDVTLLDDLGGVAVLRVSAAGSDESQIVVIERRDDSWLVRDVDDVTHQP